MIDRTGAWPRRRVLAGMIGTTAVLGAPAILRAAPSGTPVKVAVSKGANRLIVMPTGYACAAQAPPVGAVANALHALTLLIARQLISELEGLDPGIEYYVVPPLCPLVGSPYDFSRSADHIERAIKSTEGWLVRNGLGQRKIPGEMRPHGH